ncbi:MAG: hypothetical protein ACRD9L_20490, partial [Bryobacteraceae bacterium]
MRKYLAVLVLIGAACRTMAAADPPAASPAFYDRTLGSYTSDVFPGWLKLSGEFRSRVEGRTGFNFQPDDNDAYGLFRTRLNLELIPTDWLDIFAQGQDSHAVGLDSGRPLATFEDPVDLRQAYI